MAKQIVAFDVGIRNFAYCIMHHDGTPAGRVVKALEVVDMGCSKSNIQAVIDACINILDDIVYNRLDHAMPTMVLIECQMTAVMKAIQTTINVFFKIAARYQGIHVTTRYLSAKHKLNLMQKYPAFVATNANAPLASTSYKQNKQDAIRFGTWLLENELHDVATLEKVKGMKKSDDALDALLMTVYCADCM